MLIAALLVFLALNLYFFSEHFAFAQTDQTMSKLQAANNALEQSFTSVLDAEKAGANVTQLLVKLNNAGELLANAQNYYTSGNMANVISIAENVIQITDEVNVDAANLRSDSLTKSQNNILFTLIFSVVGAIVFSISLFLVWRRFKRSHMMKVLGMRPEVAENTT